MLISRYHTQVLSLIRVRTGADLKSCRKVIVIENAMYEARAEIMKALAHPARLAFADALADGEMCVCELQELVGSTMPTVSRHLSQMKSAGIVDSRREGNQVYYRLLVPCVINLFECIDAVRRNEAERLAASLQLDS